MSKVATVGGALTALKAKIEQRAEAMHARIAALDKASEDKFLLADHTLDLHEKELQQMESELRQLGNVPLLEQSPPAFPASAGTVRPTLGRWSRA